MKLIDIYSDGCVTTVAGKALAGYGVIVSENDNIIHRDYGPLPKRLSQTIENSELQGVLVALEYIKNNPGNKYVLHLDSSYAINGINGTAKRKNCRTLWERIEHLLLHDLCDTMLEVVHVEAHTTNTNNPHELMNNLCDKLAKRGANLLLRN